MVSLRIMVCLSISSTTSPRLQPSQPAVSNHSPFYSFSARRGRHSTSAQSCSGPAPAQHFGAPRFISDDGGTAHPTPSPPLRSAVDEIARKSILVRLSEHHMQFPGFGNYEVVGWKVNPQTDGTQSHHYLAEAIGGFAILIIALTSIRVWFIWRRQRQTPNPYEPVGLASPGRDLQLQPL